MSKSTHERYFFRNGEIVTTTDGKRWRVQGDQEVGPKGCVQALWQPLIPGAWRTKVTFVKVADIAPEVRAAHLIEDTESDQDDEDDEELFFPPFE